MNLRFLFFSRSFRSITCKELNCFSQSTGSSVASVAGWVEGVRVLGRSLGFIRLRDHSGSAQLVLRSSEHLKLAQSLTLESVISAKGTIVAMKEGDDSSTSRRQKQAELSVDELELLNLSKAPLPVPVADDGPSRDDNELDADSGTPEPIDVADLAVASEEARLKYRFLDLRRASMQTMLRQRALSAASLRRYFDSHGFTEVETPTLFRRTGEGAREFLVPTRRQGQFFALPQSPQQYKQLLMASGLPRYYQLARCYRDEDGRADRQLEFTQLDLELSFARAADVQQAVEAALSLLFSEVFGVKLSTPFSRMTHEEALRRFNSDKPDDRSIDSELRFLWVEDFPLFSRDADGTLQSEHHPFTAPADPERLMELLLSATTEGGANEQQLTDELLKLRGLHYDLVLNGVEIGGGSVRIHQRSLQESVFDCLQLGKAEREEFAHLLTALDYGCPPHAGFALGFDRLLAIAMKRDSVRDVLAFPKNSAGAEPMTNSPSSISEQHLKEYFLRI